MLWGSTSDKLEMTSLNDMLREEEFSVLDLILVSSPYLQHAARLIMQQMQGSIFLPHSFASSGHLNISIDLLQVPVLSLPFLVKIPRNKQLLNSKVFQGAHSPSTQNLFFFS